ncbi:MAG: hypothetical protein HYR94_29855 [Chloroflexi bacterium]|nr:hypothetical protein [Chloroflexota bacterium]
MYKFVLSLMLLLTMSIAANAVFIFTFVWKDKSSRLRGITQNVFISLFSFLVILIFLEIFFKLFMVQSDRSNLTLASHNWFNRYWSVNSLNYRDIEWTPELLERRTKVMVLGDSFVAGHGIKYKEDRFSDVLGEMLGDEYAVMNVGWGGADTRTELQNATNYPYPHDILIYSFFVNDIEETAADLGFERPNLVPSRPFLVDYSHVLNFFYWRLYRLSANDGGNYWAWLQDLYKNPEVWEVYKQDLLAIYNFSQDQNSRMIVVVFPELLATEESKPIISRVKNVFAEKGVPVLDVTELIAGMDAANLVVNSVDQHPNEFLNRLVAEKLYQMIPEGQSQQSLR